MARLKKTLSFLLAAILILTAFPAAYGDNAPVTADSAPSFFRLKNKWKSNYLYEASDGTVRYGVTAIDDQTSHWQIEDVNGNKRIKNRSTGHFITISETANRREPLKAVSIANSTADDQWLIEDSNRAGYKVIKNAKDPSANLVIHEEDQLGFAEVSGDINVTFESPQWALEPVQEGVPVRIVNQFKAGAYLFEDAEGFVQYGPAGPTDASSHWYLVKGSVDGSIRIKNRATGHFITQGVDWDKIKALPLDNTAKSEWVMGTASDPAWVNFKNRDALTADPANPQTFVLNSQFPDDKNARSNNWAQPEWGSALWKIETAYDVMPVRIVNFSTESPASTYLFESAGIVKYGPLAAGGATAPAYLWVVEDFNGKQRIRNVATGHYITSAGMTHDTDPLKTAELVSSAATDQWSIANSTIYDDYKTIQSAANAGAYVNVKDATGSAQSSAVSPETNPAQWLLEDPAAGTDGQPQIVRIQNAWQSLFLYEDGDGNLKYGNAAPDDQKAQWIIENFNGRKRIQNRATGHYINLQDMTDGHVRVTNVQGDWTSAVWVIEDLGGGIRLIHSVEDKNSDPAQQKFIHLQNLTKYAEYGVINRNWGSPQWRFLSVTDVKPANVRLKNKLTGQYLYESTAAGADEAKIKYGDVDAADKTSVWFLEDTGDGVGSIRLKNSSTGHYLVMENIGGDVSQDAPPQQLITMSDICECWGSAKWYFDPGSSEGYSLIRSAWAGHFIYTDGNGYTKVSKLAAGEDSAQFAVEPYAAPAPSIPEEPVRIRNIFNNQYLYENFGGILMYGTPAADNGYSQWIIESRFGVQWLKNRASGHYLAMNADYRFLELKDKPDNTTPEFRWAVESAPDKVNFLIRSLNGSYYDEYLNVQNGAGYAERGLYPNTFGSLQWAFEPATEEYESPSDAVAKITDTSTPVYDDTNYVRIGDPSGKGYLIENSGSVITGKASEHDFAAQWLVQDFNGRRLIKNRATGHLLGLNDQSAIVAIESSGEGSQWQLEDRLGYRTVQNALHKDGWLIQTVGGAGYGVPAATADALWSFLPVASDIQYEAEDAFMGLGVKTAAVAQGFRGQGYAEGFSAAGAKISFTVNAQDEDEFNTVIRYRNSGKSANSLQLYVNGIQVKTLAFAPSKSGGWTDLKVKLDLRAGINTISLHADKGESGQVQIDGITVRDSVGKAYRGATLPYVTYEAEQANTNASLIGPSRAYREVASEASGRQAVKLDATGEYVEFKLAKPANSIVLRYSIPDSADGKGQEAPLALYVNGKFKQNLNLTSKHAWEYGSYPWSNDPKQGSGHRFFDEIHARIGDLPAGATIRLQKDNSSTASSYILDLADMEQVADAFDMPEGYVSVTKFGALPGDGKDDTAAFNKAVAAAQKLKKGLWFPQGEFTFGNELLYLNDISIRGAGMWHTTLKGAKFIGKGKNIQVYDLLIDGDLNIRDDEASTHAFEGGFGPGSVIQNVWVEHSKTGLWLTELKNNTEFYTNGLHMVGLRLRNLMADGINFAVGTKNSVMEQSDIRYPGDDGIAMWSFTKPSVNNTARFNTVSLPWLADNIVVFGGTDNKIQDNIAKDTIVNGAGIAVSTRFNPVPFAGTTIVERNTLIRTGSHDNGYGIDLGAIWVFASDKDLAGKVVIRNNTALDSTYSGLIVHGSFNITDVLVENLVIDGLGTNGVEAVNGVKGTVKIDNVIIRGERMRPVSDSSESFSFTETGKGFSNLVKP
jgi:hypothetical protein